jgi:PDZ domain-containing protein
VDATKSRNRRYVGILALGSCLILIGGWFARPREIPQSPAPVPTETELEQLARRAERRALESASTYFAGVAREVETSVAYMTGSGASGVIWDGTRIVTSPRPPGWGRAPVTVTVASTETVVQPATGGPTLPLSTWSMSSGLSAASPARRAQALPKGGDWIVAVWRTDTAPAFTVGTFGLSSPVMCGATQVQELVSSVAFTGAMAGGGVFDIDGGLLAVVLPCGGRLVAVATVSIQAILDRQDGVEAQLLDRFGVKLAPLSAEEARYFKTSEGLLVREVWSGYPADAAGIQPGDIVTAVNGVSVAKTEDFSPRMTPEDTSLELTLSRGATRLTRTLTQAPGAEPTESHGTGLVIERSDAAYRIESVRKGSRAAAAGMRAGDRLVRIDRVEPRNLDRVTRLMDSDTSPPMWLEVLRDGRRLGVLVR